VSIIIYTLKYISGAMLVIVLPVWIQDLDSGRRISVTYEL